MFRCAAGIGTLLLLGTTTVNAQQRNGAPPANVKKPADTSSDKASKDPKTGEKLSQSSPSATSSPEKSETDRAAEEQQRQQEEQRKKEAQEKRRDEIAAAQKSYDAAKTKYTNAEQALKAAGMALRQAKGIAEPTDANATPPQKAKQEQITQLEKEYQAKSKALDKASYTFFQAKHKFYQLTQGSLPPAPKTMEATGGTAEKKQTEETKPASPKPTDEQPVAVGWIAPNVNMPKTALLVGGLMALTAVGGVWGGQLYARKKRSTDDAEPKPEAEAGEGKTETEDTTPCCHDEVFQRSTLNALLDKQGRLMGDHPTSLDAMTSFCDEVINSSTAKGERTIAQILRGLKDKLPTGHQKYKPKLLGGWVKDAHAQIAALPVRPIVSSGVPRDGSSETQDAPLLNKDRTELTNLRNETRTQKDDLRLQTEQIARLGEEKRALQRKANEFDELKSQDEKKKGLLVEKQQEIDRLNGELTQTTEMVQHLLEFEGARKVLAGAQANFPENVRRYVHGLLSLAEVMQGDNRWQMERALEDKLTGDKAKKDAFLNNIDQFVYHLPAAFSVMARQNQSGFTTDHVMQIVRLQSDLNDRLKQAGLEPIVPRAETDDFDPVRHESSPQDDIWVGSNAAQLHNKVESVKRAGFMWREQVVKPAFVKRYVLDSQAKTTAPAESVSPPVEASPFFPKKDERAGDRDAAANEESNRIADEQGSDEDGESWQEEMMRMATSYSEPDNEPKETVDQND